MWILFNTVRTANKAQSSGTLVQAIDVYCISGALIVVLSNERDSLCTGRVALSIMTEELQVAGK
jgi:hypothetical protein